MNELKQLRALATALGVRTRFVDGLGRRVEVGAETLLSVCRAMGSVVERPADAAEALRAREDARDGAELPPVIVAWQGRLKPIRLPRGRSVHAELKLEDSSLATLEIEGGQVRLPRPLPFGYHRLVVEVGGRTRSCSVIAAPEKAWRRPGTARSWGLGTHFAALRSARSRSLADLRDFETLCCWVRAQGGDVVTALPLLPTFNDAPAEPSPYAPVSRLFWSELILDLGSAHRTVDPPGRLDVTVGNAEVRSALEGLPRPNGADLDDELRRYARFRGAQARYGRNWREWPAGPRGGRLQAGDVDAEEERFHLVAQSMVRGQIRDLRSRLDTDDMRLGFDLAVGSHPDGYDPWSRQTLFAAGMSVGAPPDRVFTLGQDWGFAPILPEASRRDGHRYLAASIRHQAAPAGVLRVDHIMAMTRLYWIPQGGDVNEGTYVRYPADELFAVLTLESHRNQCELVGENLGTVPRGIHEALPRHGIPGMFLAQFEADRTAPGPPTEAQVALVGTHDTPTFAGWIHGRDIDERVRSGLADEAQATAARAARQAAVKRLGRSVGADPADQDALLASLLEWLGSSSSPLVIPWLEDLWLEPDQVNLPGTRSSERPNWQRPMARLLDEIMTDAEVAEHVQRLKRAREAHGPED